MARSDGAAGPGFDLPPLEEPLPSGLLWRPYQDVDVLLPRTPLGQRLLVEVWSDGSFEEQAGNALRFEVQPNGKARFYLRFGSYVEAFDSDVNPGAILADKPLRLRVRRADTNAILTVDAQGPAGWQEGQARFVLGDIRPFFGRSTSILAGPQGATADAQPIAPSGAFSFNRSYDALVDWKLFQRRGDAGEIPMSVFYRSPGAARLQVEVVRADNGAKVGATQQFALVAAPEGRATRLLLTRVPQGGNYHVSASLLSDSGAPLGQDEIHDIAVGDVYLVIGQSNMSGYAQVEGGETPTPEVHSFGNDYSWKEAAEPMDGDEGQVDSISVEKAGHGLMLRFGKEVAKAAGVPVGLIPAPRYGSNLNEDWARKAERPQDRGTLYGSALYRTLSQRFPAPVRGVLWYQGEGNAGSGVDNYRDLLKDFVQALRADLGSADIFLGNCQLSTIGTNQTFADLDGFLEVQEAQRQYLALDGKSVLAAFVDLPRQDDYHLDQDGVREAGRRLAVAVLQGSYGVPGALGPQIRSVKFNGGRTQVQITYDKAVVGGAAALYRVNDDLGTIEAQDARSSGAVVTVTLKRAASGAATLSYGYSSDFNLGWIKGQDGAGAAFAFKDLAVAP